MRGLSSGQGLSYRQIARELEMGKDTALNILNQAQESPETLSKNP